MQTQNNKKKDIKQRTFEFSLKIIQFISKLPSQKIYWSLGDQLLRSGTGIGANIIEGQGSSSKKEFINFIRIAFKSAKETEYWLKLFKESKLTTNSELDILVQESIEITKILNSSILTLKANNK
ncbi:hypothetical protein A2130_04175 [Candidatus Woesebacteria bacterium GWC2_33_12]|uniref:Four helix bundle protein n=1 Tax=Candidatus Woesebacteria bacterium GW2011_GWB1_33_22 TaxID=1618566 RepID=A0A0G0BYE0_9BACT|nr:MAG: hypothetical protein UR29_C0017G0008 [Candidatus Woesebacteria bacterium GW2011_GWC2_33_12]KKP41479.1 MAG: hypothetical protein UR33_C0015G0018 [Candidatus Woesebacteria bacterium GW2011_GWA2_33_20]KKP43895.1 MAG: hypothetical protein UR35_C0015G0018 [Candidatus Woesebacteria bacterium GW2011_GWB1_33_22]KKP45626.1 MAG: hypothetical protein UR37_C0017G0018 [Microgenomates group bacterium GW2011_GWC1_33_28]KKP49356.1 MAG: hypothetical protein UR41_C0016G0017 [Candidatus Woesebacteria bact